MKKEARMSQIERDFQAELRKLMDAEKLQQKELELMGRRAQEKLNQELLLQQELISNLQRRVEGERKKKEEEQERIMETQMRRKKEEERKVEESKLEEEEDRKRKEEEKVRVEREEKRKREDERNRNELKLEDEMRMMKEEEERKQKEEEKERKREEERKKVEDKMRVVKEEEERKQKEEEKERKREEERKKVEDKMRVVKEEEERKQKEEEKERKREEERKKVEDKMRVMKEEEERKQKEGGEERKKEEQRKKTEQETKKLEDKMRKMEEEERKKKEEEVHRKIEEERKKKMEKKTREEKRRIEEFGITKTIERKKQEEIRGNNEEEALIKLKEERRRRDEKEHDNLDELLKVKERKTKEESGRERRDEKEGGKKEKETKYIKEKKTTEVRRIKEEGDGKKEEPKPIEEEEQRKRKDARKLKEEEQRRRLKEKTKEEGYRKSEEEIKLREEQAGCEGYEGDTQMEQDTKTKEQKLDEEKRKKLEAEEHMKEESTQRATRDRTSSSSSAPSHSQSTVSRTGTGDQGLGQRWAPEENFSRTSAGGGARPGAFLPQRTEERRLAWMKDCVSWSSLSLQNRSRPDGPARRRRGPGGAPGSGGLPPLCPDSVLRSAGRKSLQEVTSVTLEDLPGRCLSTLAQCAGLRTLTLRRCGLQRLDAIKQLPQLCYVDVQENDISYVDCENMSSLRVLQLGRNKLTSIHGLTGAIHLDLLDLSHNSITRIAGLESTRRLQRLSVDHNQLISTKGLRDVYTLLHLSCSHNHLASVEGLENSALLHTLDVRGNSLTEPPSLKNQVLLRELRLDDNSLSSLQGLAACWLPLMQHLSVAQNRITQLPPMSDSVSLASLDLRFNCMSELRNVCESLEGCAFLRELHLRGNPVQQERGWRSALQRAAPGLTTIDGQHTDCAPRPPAAGRAPGGFLEFCQAQLQRTLDLQRLHSGELRSAASPLDAVKFSCRHLTEALQLAEDQRVAHERGDTAADDTQPTPEGVGRGPQSTHRHLDLQNTAAVVIQQLWRKYRQKCGNISSFPTAEKGGGGGGGGAGGGGGGGRGKSSPGPSYVSGSLVGPDHAATVIQARWRGCALRRRLAAALAAVTRPGAGEDDALEEVDVDEFVFDEAALGEPWTVSFSEDPPPRRCPSSESLTLPGCFPESSKSILPSPLVWRPRQAWPPGEQVEAAEQRDSPETSSRRKSTASTSERKEKILQEWGFTDSNTALQMLKRAQKMKSTTQWPKKRNTSGQLAFRNGGYPPRPISAGKRPAPHSRSDVKGRGAEPGLRTAGVEQVERVERGGAQAAHPDSDSERQCACPPPPDGRTDIKMMVLVVCFCGDVSERGAHLCRPVLSVHFLPEISPNVLKGGRVQLVADPGHAASALGVGPADRPSEESPGRKSNGPPGATVPSARRVASAPPKRERISHRDAAVQMSGGWGGGKKRDKVYK
ncbi:leucine-rich repeat- and IQ domain-containing protein 1 isoform 6-T6 [Spinachia spinachia]